MVGNRSWTAAIWVWDLVGGDRELFLERVVGIGFCPGGDEWDAHPALVVSAFFPTQGRGTGDFVLVTERGIGAVVSHKNDEGVFRYAQIVEVIQHIAEGFVHAFDERGEGLGGGRFARIFVVVRKPGIGLERSVNGVVGEVEVERFAAFYGLGDALLCFDRQCFGEKGFGPMVVFQMRHGVMGTLGPEPIVFFSIITAGSAEGGASHVDIESQIERLRTFVIVGTEVRFTDVNGLVAVVSQHTWERDVAFLQSFPVPIRSAVWAGIVLTGIDPVGGPVARRVLSGHDGDPRGGTDAHGVELVEADSLVWRGVPCRAYDSSR